MAILNDQLDVGRYFVASKIQYEDPNALSFGFFPRLPEIKRVIFHNPATIVYWSDNTKTVVKCGPHDIFNPEVGLAMAMVKKVFANNDAVEFHRIFKKHVPNVEEPAEVQEATAELEAARLRAGINLRNCNNCVFQTSPAGLDPCLTCLKSTRRVNYTEKE